MAAEGLLLTEWEVACLPAGSCDNPEALNTAAADWVRATVPGTAASAWRDVGRWAPGVVHDFDDDDWWFRTSFGSTDPDAMLCLDGLATVVDVWLNGSLVLQSDNMFTAHEVPVRLTDQNDVVIACRSVRRHLQARRPRGRWKTRLIEMQQLRWVRTSFSGRMPGWQPTCAPVGPWRPVRVMPFARSLSVTSIQARLVDGDGVVDLVATAKGPLPESAWIEIDGSRFALEITPGSEGHRVAGSVTVSGVRPWFPATHGEPVRSAVRVGVVSDGVESAIDLPPVGFRSVVLDETDGAFRLSINGLPIFCRGACWIPTDIVRLSDSPDRLRVALSQLADAGANMVRVLGISVYEHSQFFEQCDELGIMVWHDLMFANLDQPLDDDLFRASVVEEIEQFLRSCQAHPSVVVVGGGSEVEQQAAMMGVDPAIGRNRVGRELLPGLLDSMLPGVASAPCSPSGGIFPFHVGVGVSHYYGVGAYLRPLSDARLAGVRFTTECLAFANVPCRQTVDELLADGDRPGHSPGWKARVPRDRGAGWDFEDVRDHYVEAFFDVNARDVRSVDPDRYLDLGRAAVCIAIEATLGEFRSRRSTCDGALVFTARDPWAGPGWGIVDALGRPKSAYWAAGRAWKPQAVLLRDEGLDGLFAVLINDRPHALDATLRARLFDDAGLVVGDADVPVAVLPRGEFVVSVDGMFDHFRDLTRAYRFGPAAVDVVEVSLVGEAGEIDVAHHLPGGHRRDRRADVGLRAWTEPGTSAVHVATEGFAQFVSIDIDDAAPVENWFHLSPGQERVVSVTSLTGAPWQGGDVRALNAVAVRSIRAAEGES